VARVGDELAHPFLGPLSRRCGLFPGVERGLDLGQHGVERAAEPPDLGPGIAVGHPLGQVARGDRLRGELDVGQRAQAAADGRDADDGQRHQHDRAHDQIDAGQFADGVVGVGYIDAYDDGAGGHLPTQIVGVRG
jgi:hypothetical protein